MALDALLDIRPTFFVPRLAEKPQNPVMDTLYLLNHGRKYPILTDRLPIELEVITNDLQLAVENSYITQGNLWDYVATQKAAESVRKICLALRSNCDKPLLSELLNVLG